MGQKSHCDSGVSNHMLRPGVPAPVLQDSSLLKVQEACLDPFGHRIEGSNSFGGVDVLTCMCHSILIYTKVNTINAEFFSLS